MRSVVGDYFYFRERRTRFVVCALILATCNDLKRGRQGKGWRKRGEEKKNNERHGNQREPFTSQILSSLFERGWRKEFDPFRNFAKMGCVGGESRKRNNLTG